MVERWSGCFAARPSRPSRDPLATADRDVELSMRGLATILPDEPLATRRRSLSLPLAATGAALLLSACMPTGPEARRASYLDCARDQGVDVEAGTIRTRSGADLAQLDACRAVPR